MEQLPDIQESIERRMEKPLEMTEEIKNELEKYHGEPVVEISLKTGKESIFLYGAEKAFEYLASGPAQKIPYRVHYKKEGVYHVISGTLDTEKSVSYTHLDVYKRQTLNGVFYDQADGKCSYAQMELYDNPAQFASFQLGGKYEYAVYDYGMFQPNNTAFFDTDFQVFVRCV